ncbi:M23 family metallopeptidase [Prochlorothrix hollandica]|uniref:M23 family metallopeptidase n=1 Tax=Prochlorothrix hollandica TaxID=1223 RepID=UPI000375D007|nr:M23 family metallopeptidase [Prochlorothrix hollandica]
MVLASLSLGEPCWGKPWHWLKPLRHYLRHRPDLRRQSSHSLTSAAQVLALTATILGSGSPGAWALDVQITPTHPQLGDTLSVVVHTADDPAPQLRLNQQVYPLFPLGGDRFRALIPTTPQTQPGPQRLDVSAAGEVRQISWNLKDRSFPIQRIWLPPGKDDLGSDLEFDRVDAFKTLVSPKRLWQGAFLRPTSGEVTSIYGIRRYYNGEFAEDYFHRGVDYGAGTGTPVVAPADGIVALVGYEANGFELHGNTVGLDHGQGVLSIMIHLNSIQVWTGQFVKAGEVIGTVGSTGAATGPHLHWGLYVQGQAVDPVPWREGVFE